MARIKRGRSGLTYFGKKVETQEIRFDKNVFVEKLAKKIINDKSVSKTTQVTRDDGSILHETFSGRKETIGDSNVTISDAGDLFLNNFFIMSPSSDRTFQLPTEDNVLSVFPDFTTFQAHRFTIINTGGANVEVTGSDVISEKIAPGGTLLNGNMIVSGNTSGTFMFIRDGAFIDVVRILEQ